MLITISFYNFILLLVLKFIVYEFYSCWTFVIQQLKLVHKNLQKQLKNLLRRMKIKIIIRKEKENIMRFTFINLLQSIIIFNSILSLQEAILFKDWNLTVHSFLNTALIYKCKGDFYYVVPITRNENNNIKLLWITMVILIIGLTILFNNYIIPTELFLRLLHGIKSEKLKFTNIHTRKHNI
jgi:hypothetical protein